MTLRTAEPRNVHLVELDVTRPETIAAAHRHVVETGADRLDVLVNNAGVNATTVRESARVVEPASATPDGGTDLARVDLAVAAEVLAVNVLGALAVTQRFLDLLTAAAGAKVVNISSRSGSITLKTTGGNYAYSASKAALNMATRAMAADLARLGIVVVPLYPGWIRSRLGGPDAPLRPEDAAAAVVRAVDGLKPTDGGRFVSAVGPELPW